MSCKCDTNRAGHFTLDAHASRPVACKSSCCNSLIASQHTAPVNSLAPGKFEWNFRYVIFKQILVIDGWGIPCEIDLVWMSHDFTDDQSTLIQVMAWCRQATSHYLSQCWPRSLSPYGVTRPQWFNFDDPCTDAIMCQNQTGIGLMLAAFQPGSEYIMACLLRSWDWGVFLASWKINIRDALLMKRRHWFHTWWCHDMEILSLWKLEVFVSLRFWTNSHIAGDLGCLNAHVMWL